MAPLHQALQKTSFKIQKKIPKKIRDACRKHLDLNWLLKSDARALRFALRASLASSLALMIAFALKLDSPQWAAVTVWLVIFPSRGMTFAKGYQRVLGTLVGSIVAILLIVSLGQSPPLFILALAIWVGLCSATSSLLRHFKAYGAMLAGVTTSVVGLLVFSHPENVYSVAIERMGSILIGIAVTLLVSSTLSKSRSREELFAKIRELTTETMAWVARSFLEACENQDISLDGVDQQERRLVARISEIELLAHYASAESLYIRLRTRKVHGLLSSLLALMSTARSIDSRLKKRLSVDVQTQMKSIALLLQETAQLMSDSSHGSTHAEPPANMQAAFSNSSERALAHFNALNVALSNLGLELTQAPDHNSSHEILAERILELRDTLTELARVYFSLQEKSQDESSVSQLSFHRDWQVAKRVGLRTCIAVGAAGLSWLIYPSSAMLMLVMMTAINCSIFANFTNPIGGIKIAAKSTIAAAALALLCHWVLPNGSGSILTLIALGLLLLPAGLVIANPRTALAGALFSANFYLFLAPTNPIFFSWNHFVSIFIGYFISLAFAFITFRFVFPTDARRRLRALHDEILSDLESIFGAKSKAAAIEWETRMYSRVGRLIQISDEVGPQAPEVLNSLIQGAFAAIDLGHEALRLQSIIDSDLTPPSAIRPLRKVMMAVRRVSRDPAKAIVRLRFLARQLVEMGHSYGGPHELHLQRAASLIEEMASIIATNPRFFTRQVRRGSRNPVYRLSRLRLSTKYSAELRREVEGR